MLAILFLKRLSAMVFTLASYIAFNHFTVSIGIAKRTIFFSPTFKCRK